MRMLRKKLLAFLLVCLLLVMGVSCNDTKTPDTITADNKSDYEKYLDEEIKRIESDLIGKARESSPPAKTETEKSNYQDNTVYVSNYGKIHKSASCSGMKYYTSMSYSTARGNGHVPCSKCY